MQNMHRARGAEIYVSDYALLLNIIKSETCFSPWRALTTSCSVWTISLTIFSNSVGYTTHTHTHHTFTNLNISHNFNVTASNSRCTIHTHTHPFNSPFSGTTQVSQYQKGKTNLDFTEARDSEWQWHQLGHMQNCILLQTDNHASIPPFSFLQAGCPSCCPTNSVKALKATFAKSEVS